MELERRREGLRERDGARAKDRGMERERVGARAREGGMETEGVVARAMERWREGERGGRS